MRIKLILALCSIAACSTDLAIEGLPLGVASHAALVSTGCDVPAAIPDDGLDDRAAIQLALDTQHCAFLPAGVYDIDTPQAVAPARRPYMMLLVSGAQIYGDGPATVLRFRGSGQLGDWQGLRLTGDHPSVHDLKLDTGDTYDTDEQTHAIVVLGPSASPSVTHVDCYHPQNPLMHKGSCVQFVGYNDGRLITDITVEWNTFEADRSGVDDHGGTIRGTINHNAFNTVGNTDIDLEGDEPKFDLEIAYNTMTMSPGLHGTGAIQLQQAHRTHLHDNMLNGRGIDVGQSDDVEIDHNLVTQTQLTGTPVLSIGKSSARANVHHNVFTRESAAGAGAVVRAVPHGTGVADHLTVSDNVLVQNTTGPMVDTGGIVGLYVSRNVLTYTGAANGAYGLVATGLLMRTTDVHFDNNIITGPLAAAIGMSGSYFGSGTLGATGNTAAGLVGVKCGNINQQGGITGPFTVSGNTWAPSQCAPLVVAPQ